MDLWAEVGDLIWLPVTDDQARVVASEHEALIEAIESQQPERARGLAEQHVQAETERLLSLRLRLPES
jgi:DNA-binding FadR family transcriptional regulator